MSVPRKHNSSNRNRAARRRMAEYPELSYMQALEQVDNEAPASATAVLPADRGVLALQQIAGIVGLGVVALHSIWPDGGVVVTVGSSDTWLLRPQRDEICLELIEENSSYEWALTGWTHTTASMFERLCLQPQTDLVVLEAALTRLFDAMSEARDPHRSPVFIEVEQAVREWTTEQSLGRLKECGSALGVVTTALDAAISNGARAVCIVFSGRPGKAPIAWLEASFGDSCRIQTWWKITGTDAVGIETSLAKPFGATHTLPGDHFVELAVQSRPNVAMN